MCHETNPPQYYNMPQTSGCKIVEKVS